MSNFSDNFLTNPCGKVNDNNDKNNNKNYSCPSQNYIATFWIARVTKMFSGKKSLK